MTIIFDMDRPQYFNDAADIARLFFPYANYERAGQSGKEDALVILQRMDADGGTAIHSASLTVGGRELGRMRLGYEWINSPALMRKKLEKRGIKIALFRMLKEYTGKRLPWGSLTGIRPTKLIYELMEQGMDEAAAFEFLTGKFDVSPSKARLAMDVITGQRGLRLSMRSNEIDVYIGIPFCTTRCAYCSFASLASAGRGGLMERYVGALEREIKAFAGKMPGVRAMYFGGGTPTALEAGQLEKLIGTARGTFPGEYELTVEAGRPDTIGRETLAMLRRMGVSRISVNPQTMNAGTLRTIGRAHSPEDTNRAFALAREMGCDNINMDIIAGLPGEDEAVFSGTLEAIARLKPESLTVHTLAVKRASIIHEHIGEYSIPGADVVERMVDEGRAAALDFGMVPYYMYRQKHMAGSLENVGYALPGKQCVYNIDMMEESHGILALGAGGISKRVFPAGNRLERCPNVKNVEQYIERIEEMIERKLKFFEGMAST